MSTFDYEAWQAACDAVSDAGGVWARASYRWELCLTAKLRAAGGRGAARAERRFQRVCAECRAASARAAVLRRVADALAPEVRPFTS